MRIYDIRSSNSLYIWIFDMGSIVCSCCLYKHMVWICLSKLNDTIHAVTNTWIYIAKQEHEYNLFWSLLIDAYSYTLSIHRRTLQNIELKYMNKPLWSFLLL